MSDKPSKFAGGKSDALCGPTCEAPDLIGPYLVESRFALLDGLPVDELGPLNQFIELTDDPYDPATWLLDRISTELPPEYAAALELARSWFVLDEHVHRFLIDNSPSFFRRVVDLGKDLGQVVNTLGLQTRLTISYDPLESSGGVATHEITGAVFWVNDRRYEFTVEEMKWPHPHIAAYGIPLRVRPDDTLDIEQHLLSLPYGALLLYAVENVIIPRQDPMGRTFNDLLAGLVDCDRLGVLLAEELEQGTPADYTTACLSAMGDGLDAIDALLREKVDLPAKLTITGNAIPVDEDCDCRINTLQNGTWAGELTFEDGTAALPAPDQQFTGIRED